MQKALSSGSSGCLNGQRLPSLDLINRVLFPAPKATYGLNDFPEELIWIPKSLDPDNAQAEECVPCLLLTSPSARFFVLYLHSNAEDLGRCYSFCSMLRYQFQVNVLAVEYPGYGICPGTASEESVIENAFLGFNFLQNVLGWPPDEIMIMGRSIGTGPALAIASQRAINGLILVCPFLSVRELVREFAGTIADMMEERFPNKELMRLVASPLLLIHGKADSVVPWSHGKTLYETCTARKRLVAPESMRHNSNLHSDAGWFVLPMLQFFAVPDYKFEDWEVPAWAYDKRRCPLYSDDTESSQEGGSACLPCRNSPPGPQECVVVESGFGPRPAARQALQSRPGPQASKARLTLPINEASAACPASPTESVATASAGAATGSTTAAGGGIKAEAGDASAEEEAADAALESTIEELADRFLAQTQGSSETQSQSNGQGSEDCLLEEASLCEIVPMLCTHAEEEPPSPPDDLGFFKVPRSRRAEPGVAALSDLLCHRPITSGVDGAAGPSAVGLLAAAAGQGGIWWLSPLRRGSQPLAAPSGQGQLPADQGRDGDSETDCSKTEGDIYRKKDPYAVIKI